MSNIEVTLPALGDGINSADILEILVREGDVVAAGQDIIELETDKATTGVPSAHAGRVVKIHVAEGASVPIGATLITLAVAEPAKIELPNRDGQATQRSPASDEPPVPQTQKTPLHATKQDVAPALERTTVPDARAALASDLPATTTSVRAPSSPPVAKQAEDMSAVSAGPSIRRLAREVGIDLRRVEGTGKNGRITRNDVMAAVRRSNQSQTPTAGGSERDTWGPIQVKKLSKIRKTIAAKMHESWSTVPRVTNFDDADMTELEKFRQASKQDYAAKGIKLTAMPFVVKAVAMSLKSHPDINASLDPAGDQAIYKNYVNVGIAVDTERGLIVPSLRGADKLSIPQIAQQLSDIVANVRDGEFTPDDLRGNTFTISNLGAVGGTYSTPIINVPEVAILLLGRSRQMPIARDGEILVRLMMPLSLSYDHRLVDGAMAARFLNDVIGYLEAPGRLLLSP